MMKVFIITFMVMVPLLGALFGDRFFMRWFPAEVVTEHESE